MGQKDDKNKGFDTRLTALDEKIAAAQAKPEVRPEETNNSRLGFEFSASVLGGGFLGWLIDHFCHTTPWFMLIFFILGFIAGMVSMFKALKNSAKD